MKGSLQFVKKELVRRRKALFPMARSYCQVVQNLRILVVTVEKKPLNATQKVTELENTFSYFTQGNGT